MPTETESTVSTAPSSGAVPEPSGDARTWAALAHASTLLSLAGGLGLIGALVIWLTQKDTSRWVAFHALQSLIFQGATLLAIVVFVGVTWTLGFVFSAVTLGFGALVAVPFMFITFAIGGLFWLAGLIYGLYGAYQVYEGREFRYLWVGDWLARRMARPRDRQP
jgi:hypothetical protein